jgi:uncharacterized protein (TIGR02147 family)
MKKTIFEFTNYKYFLGYRLDSRRSKRGEKSALAKAMGIQATYLSQVLNGSAHLSLEQVEAMSEYFAHSKEEAHFLLLLVQKDRAGTGSLRKYFQEQMTEILNRRLVLTQRLGAQNSLGEQEKVRYYSSWIYAAIHIAVTIPELQNKEALSSHLGLSVRKINEALEFLVPAGLVVVKGTELTSGTNMIRLGSDSHNIIKHHTNWRQQSTESLDREKLTDLHYSAVVSLSRDDVLKLKNILLDMISLNLDLIKASKEEVLYCYCLDFFSLDKKAE